MVDIDNIVECTICATQINENNHFLHTLTCKCKKYNAKNIMVAILQGTDVLTLFKTIFFPSFV